MSISLSFNCFCIFFGNALLLPLNIFIRILVFSLSELKMTYLLLSYFLLNMSISSSIVYMSLSSILILIILISAYPCLFRTSLNIPIPSITRNCEYTSTLPGDVLISSYICANFGLHTLCNLSISRYSLLTNLSIASSSCSLYAAATSLFNCLLSKSPDCELLSLFAFTNSFFISILKSCGNIRLISSGNAKLHIILLNAL